MIQCSLTFPKLLIIISMIIKQEQRHLENQLFKATKIMSELYSAGDEFFHFSPMFLINVQQLLVVVAHFFVLFWSNETGHHRVVIEVSHKSLNGLS